MVEILATKLRIGDAVNVVSRSHGKVTRFPMKVRLNLPSEQEGNRQIEGWDKDGNYISIGGGTIVEPIEEGKEVRFLRTVETRKDRNNKKRVMLGKHEIL